MHPKAVARYGSATFSNSACSIWLPVASDLAAVNAPLVTSRDRATGVSRDHESYVVNKGGADIFFPVDFAALKQLYKFYLHRENPAAQTRQVVKVVKSPSFLAMYADLNQTTTRSGYNPLIEDFWNTAFFLSSVEDP
jgi:hypothetical protein